MEAAKTFERDGKRYRPGDAIPDGLDAVTLAHYKRHGMVREPRTKPAPSEKKPAGPGHNASAPGSRRNATPKPAQTATLRPVESVSTDLAPLAGLAAVADQSPPAAGPTVPEPSLAPQPEDQSSADGGAAEGVANAPSAEG